MLDYKLNIKFFNENINHTKIKPESNITYNTDYLSNCFHKNYFQLKSTYWIMVQEIRIMHIELIALC